MKERSFTISVENVRKNNFIAVDGNAKLGGMKMFIENKIIFGKGTIAVSSDTTFRSLILEYLEPPSPVGSEITKDEYEKKTTLGKKIFTYRDDMNDLMNELKEVSSENPIIEFRGYLLDFSNFNPDSVRIVKEHLKKAIMGNPLTWAC